MQNDRDFLRATAVTRGCNGYRNGSQHSKLTLEKKFSRRSVPLGLKPETHSVSIMIPSGGALPLSHPLSPSCGSSMSVSGLLIKCQIYAAVICISVSWTWACRLGLGQSSLKSHRCRVSRFGVRASARFRFGSRFSSKRLCFVSGHCLCPQFLTRCN